MLLPSPTSSTCEHSIRVFCISSLLSQRLDRQQAVSKPTRLSCVSEPLEDSAHLLTLSRSPKPVQAYSMAPITFDQFRNTLAAAAAQRGRDYTNVYSMTARWERDDTNAAQDSERFQKMLKDLDLSPAIEFIIPHDPTTPVNRSQKALLDLMEECEPKSATEHNLMIFHYAGHGMRKGGSFTFAETRAAKKTLDADHALLNNIKVCSAERIDALIILDCCYAHVATRAPIIPNRIVEVIAATSIQTPAARSAPHNTFTVKLAGEVARRRRAGHKNVEFADIFQSLRSCGDKVK
ncbi:uncharacterized protein BO80DRAFT_486636 [Aspergillus ibericus CBS 121593]|uniref:Peptidase C14 caspase domain-containing protein n=1 Tax=Aspergillus ibericus CBS 121593 TaxID=1448316 RepID=A0A395H8S2_9EURO|nr:hypothetical protein BO80DRAFT_486636 [Aspergillus ibericus CBS 121593]RAL04242.1 hypothetical protein BO80DRAFT_486636 [Aspergillus ibericus CBS 121593]